jgi:hypothetical protein
MAQNGNGNGTTIVRVRFWAIVVVVGSVIAFLCNGFSNHSAILASHASEIRAIHDRQDRSEQYLKRIEDKLDRLIERR